MVMDIRILMPLVDIIRVCGWVGGGGTEAKYHANKIKPTYLIVIGTRVVCCNDNSIYLKLTLLT